MALLLMAPTVRAVQKKIGYKFKNAHYLWEAVQAPGSVIRCGEVKGAETTHHSDGYQSVPDGHGRLAILGDSVLRLAIVENWYEEEGARERASRIISDVGSNTNLDMVGRANGLDTLVNRHLFFKDAPVGRLTMAGTIEAIIGAVYLDSNMENVMDVMHNIGLMPRLVRRVTTKVPISERVESPEESIPAVQNQDTRNQDTRLKGWKKRFGNPCL